MRVGFIIDGYIPSLSSVVRAGFRLDRFLLGWNTPSPTGRMRFGWIAEEANRHASVRYELFRVWHRYDVVVFIKSFTAASLALASELRAGGTRVVFDINVDYFTPAAGEFRYDTMAPSEAQRGAATAMARESDLVLTASRHLAEVCAPIARRVEWVPDNVNFALVPSTLPASAGAPVNLWWSGEAVKLFELLAIEDSLRKCAGRFRLRLVTSSLAALEKWRPDLKARFLTLIADLRAEVIPFTTLTALFVLYHEGGFIVSPRYLDNTYNLGHSEWKLTLGMACGLPAIASPVPSYRELTSRASPGAVRLCDHASEWDAAFAQALEGNWGDASAARDVVRAHYSTDVVAQQHRSLLQSLHT